MFSGIIISAYYVTKWIGGVQFQKNQGKNIKIIESIGIGPQKVLQLIQVGTQIFLIGITKEHIIFITEIDSTNIICSNQEEGANVSFQSYLKQWLDKREDQKKDH